MLAPAYTSRVLPISGSGGECARGIHTRAGLKPVKRKTHSGRTSREWLEIAFARDRAGRESEAIPFYRKAISSGGLTHAQQRDALICLGSSYSTVGQSGGAVRCLNRARKLFPEDPVIELFLALVLARSKSSMRAVRILGAALIRDSGHANLRKYRTVLIRKYRGLTAGA
jgi:tetratricopeptide (TPR) repeat protein